MYKRSKNQKASKQTQILPKLSSAIAKVRHGIPRPMKHRDEPPQLSTTLCATVKVRVPVTLKAVQYDATKAYEIVFYNSTQTAGLNIYYPYNRAIVPTFTGSVRVFFDYHYMFRAAYYQYTGIDFAEAGNEHVINSVRFAMEAVKYYGPTRQNISDVSLRTVEVEKLLTCSEFSLSDVPSGQNRAFIGFNMPKLMWRNYVPHEKAGIEIKYTGLMFPSLSSNQSYTQIDDLGALDCVVHFRRHLSLRSVVKRNVFRHTRHKHVKLHERFSHVSFSS